MKPLTLHPHESRQCLQSGSVLVVRPIVPQPTEGFRSMVCDCDINGGWWFSDMPRTTGPRQLSELAKWKHEFPKSPFGAIGTRLWARERWKPTGLCAFHDSKMLAACSRFAYEADEKQETRDVHIPWRQARHMPEHASRLTVTPTSIEVKRVQDVTEEEAVAAGFRQGEVMSAVYYFMEHWDKANPKHPWEQSPWCWMAKLEVVK